MYPDQESNCCKPVTLWCINRLNYTGQGQFCVFCWGLRPHSLSNSQLIGIFMLGIHLQPVCQLFFLFKSNGRTPQSEHKCLLNTSMWQAWSVGPSLCLLGGLGSTVELLLYWKRGFWSEKLSLYRGWQRKLAFKRGLWSNPSSPSN